MKVFSYKFVKDYYMLDIGWIPGQHLNNCKRFIKKRLSKFRRKASKKEISEILKDI